jgi:hypothetical protein
MYRLVRSALRNVVPEMSALGQVPVGGTTFQTTVYGLSAT